MFFHVRSTAHDAAGGPSALVATVVCPFGPVVFVSYPCGEVEQPPVTGGDVRLTWRERRAWAGLVRRLGAGS
jgi:hypothetical protein